MRIKIARDIAAGMVGIHNIDLYQSINVSIYQCIDVSISMYQCINFDVSMYYFFQ